jgi:outer membrane protein assembly factor BamB
MFKTSHRSRGELSVMNLSVSPSHPRVPLRSILSRLGFLLVAISSHPFLAAPQSAIPAALFVTPSTTTLLIGEQAAFNAVDQSGRPLTDVKWSLEPDLADLNVENGEASIQTKKSGRAILTASYNEQTASAVISVLADTKIPSATVRWSLQPLPGFETLFVMQAVPSPGGPVFFSIEWSKTAHAVVRALGVSGQQLWAAQLSSTVTPATLKHSLPATGQVYQNETLLSDHSLFIIGDKSAFAQNNATDPSAYNLPSDKDSILLHAVGDMTGGLVLLERGRFRDSLAFLRPGDGMEGWRYNSTGRLNKSWTVNYNGDIGIVETIAKPASSALLIINAVTGEVRFRIPFPISSSTIDGYRCADPLRNILKSLRPSLFGSVFTNSDGNMYVQVETHIESQTIEACKNKAYSFDDSLALLRVTPDGETDWTTFQHIHADGAGDFVVQPRVFAGETIPDGFGGVLAAWTYVFPGSKDDKQVRSEARLSRIGPEGQRDFTLPMPWWTKGLNSFFDSAMVLGDGNVLYATNGLLLLRFDTQAGELGWVRHPPTGEVKLQFATGGGGVLVANAGFLVHFNAQGFGQNLPWTVAATNPDDIGLAQTDLFDQTSSPPLQLRDLQMCWAGNFIAVEDGAPYGQGSLIYFGQ